MKRLLFILLLAAATAHGQIDNPPTSVNIVDATATGRAVLTATNAAAAATAIGLGTTNSPTFRGLTLDGGTNSLFDEVSLSMLNADGPWSIFSMPSADGPPFDMVGQELRWGSLYVRNDGRLYQKIGGIMGEASEWGKLLYLDADGGATNARSSLGIATTNAVTFSNITASGTLAVSNTATFATNVSVAGSLTVGSFTTTTPSTWALDATQTAAATNGVLTLPSNANVIRLTNNNAISSVTNGVLGAFYYLVNQATNAVTISNVGGITIDGAQNLALSPNESATLVATGPTNVSVAARGDLTDVALGGTANTAPSQTASSGSSLMTRGLSDTRFYPLASFWLPAEEMQSYNSAGTGNPTWTTTAGIVNMVTPFGRSPRTVAASGTNLSQGIYTIPTGWPEGAQVRITTYLALFSGEATTNTFELVLGGYWTTNTNIISPVSTAIGTTFPANSLLTTNVTGTGTTNEYYKISNTFSFATNANRENRQVYIARTGTATNDTATNTIYFIGSHVELLP
jgi:hypothetical protein